MGGDRLQGHLPVALTLQVGRSTVPGPGPGLARELIARGLATADDVIAGDLAMTDMSRRNANVLVTRRRGPSHFLKRATDVEQRRRLANEALALRRLSVPATAAYVPAVRAFAPGDGLLVLEGFPDAQDLKSFHAEEANGYPPAIAARLGSALAALHGATPADDDPDGPPWAFMIHRPTVDALGDFTPACLDLTRMVQREPTIGRALDELRAGWRAKAPIHGDLRWENVLLVEPEHPGSPIRIVDWEETARGEPLWDVGCAIAGYLSSWTWSIVLRRGALPDDLERHARRPLGSLQRALGALWDAYLAGRAPADATDDPTAPALRMAGVRLLAIAHEATRTSRRLGPHHVLHVQLAANLLARPEGFAAYFGVARRPGA